MKLSFPTRFPPVYVLAFSGAILAAAWAEGTPVTVAALAASFFVISGLAFNVAGGMVYPSGSYILFVSVLTMGLGIVAKIFFDEPLDTHLRDAEKSMLVYNGGMLGMYAAAFLNRHLRLKRPLLLNTLRNVDMDQLAMGCVMIGLVGPLVIPESAQSMFNQINSFLPFAILLPVYARAKETDGKSTFSWISLGVFVYMTVVFGLLTFSKQGIFAASAAWVVAACAAGYRIGKVRLLVLIATGVVAISILTPYSQIGRQYRFSPDLVDQGLYLLQHPLETRELYELRSELAQATTKTEIHWFDHPQGLLDRLTVLPIDDALIYATDHGHQQGLYVLATYYMNAVPHFLFPNKPDVGWGNVFAHEIGLLAKNDHSTGVSFSPFSDAYHDGQWLAILVIAPLMFLVLFFVVDSVAGSTNDSVWGIFYILYFSHYSAEAMMNVTTYAPSTVTLGLIFAAWVIARIAPLLGQLVTPPKPTTLRRVVGRL